LPVIEASFYEKKENQKVRCKLCPHNCLISDRHKGLCRVRYNEAGILKILNYGEISALAIDPVEKKPLFHFHPGCKILSTGTFGCNFFCGFCQNFHIAHERPVTQYITADEMVALSVQANKEGSIGLAFTYNEPSIWYEYILDTAIKAKEKDQKIVLVTNGFIEQKPLEKLLNKVDALNIDVKAFNEEFYRKICHGRLDIVKKNVEESVQKAHVEITNLIISEEYQSLKEIKELALWLSTLNPDIPLHLSRYYPAYKFKHQPTSMTTMQAAYETAREHLNFVYIGNIDKVNNTFCVNCGTLLIKRHNYNTSIEGVAAGKCLRCGNSLDYIVF